VRIQQLKPKRPHPDQSGRADNRQPSTHLPNHRAPTARCNGVLVTGPEIILQAMGPRDGNQRCHGGDRTTLRSAQVVCSGHAFVQNLRRGHYELGLDVEPGRRLEAIFIELALAI
jgi:hypothetical protein